MLTIEQAKTNAVKDLEDLVLEKLKEEFLKYNLGNNIISVSKKIISFHISPFVTKTFDKYIDDVKNILENSDKDDDETQFEVNSFLNSKLSMFEKTKMQVSSGIALKDIVKYIKLQEPKKNYKKEKKRVDTLRKLEKKYNL